jgi:hypothetical protein
VIAAALIALSLAGSVARAQDAPTRIAIASEAACPSRGELLAALGPAFAEGGGGLEVHLSVAGPALVATIALRGADPVERTLPAEANCGTLARTLAIVIRGYVLDHPVAASTDASASVSASASTASEPASASASAASASASEPATASASASEPASASGSEAADAAVDPDGDAATRAAPIRTYLSISGGLALALDPGVEPAAIAELDASLSAGPFRVRISIALSSPTSIAQANEPIDFLPLALRGDLGLELAPADALHVVLLAGAGALAAEARAAGAGSWRAIPIFVLSALGEIDLLGPLRLRFEIGFDVPLLRERYVVEPDGRVGASPAAIGRALVGIGLRVH